MKYDITLYGNPVLRQPGEPVREFDDTLQQLIADMKDAMYDAAGIGLAAQQVGQTLMLCLVDVPADMDVDAKGQRLNPDIAMPLVLVNPEVVEHSEEQDGYEEGCLSFPGLSGVVTRPVSIKLKYQDAIGAAQQLEASGLVARAIQHEVDHLNGKLFIDYMSQVKRLAIAGKLKRLKKEGMAQA